MLIRPGGSGRRMPCKWTALLMALALLGAACSSGRSGAAPPVATPAPSAISPPATTPRPGVISIVASTEAWTLPAPVSRPVVLPDEGGFVVLGGLATGDVSTSRIVRVDVASGSSQISGNLAVPVHDSAGAMLGGRFFVFGGGSFTTVAVVQGWTAGSATEAAMLPQARSDLSTVTVNGTSYVVGGFDGSAMTPEVLATTDGVSFRTVANLAVPVRYAAVAATATTLWVIGGVTSTSEGGTAETDAVQKVDLSTGQVTVPGRLPHPLGHAAALTLDGAVFVFGGRSGTVPSAAIWRLDPAQATLTPAGQLPGPVSDAGSVVVDGVGYLVGGEVTGPAQPRNTVVALRPSLQPG